MAIWRPPPRSLADVRDDPFRFPRSALRGAQTALCVFAAEWHGRQDAYWLAEAGLFTTCVDLNGQKLAEMSHVYPDSFNFVEADAFSFLEGEHERWDVITLDPFTGETMDRCHSLLPRLCELANRTVIVGSTTDQVVRSAPDGWSITEVMHRSDWGGGVYWTVVAKDDA